MGKFNNSDIHQRYSDWHWQLIQVDPKYKALYQSDVDRFWIEFDFEANSSLAALDLKYQDNNKRDSISPTEKGVYDHFERVGIKVYIVYISYDFNSFKVYRYKQAEYYSFSGIGYADWLLGLRAFRINSF